MLKKIGAFTLLEIMMVLVIIGILATIALPNLGRMRERGLDREVMANLKLIQAAERIYRMDIGEYYPVTGFAQESNIGTINSFLKLSLTAGTNRDWDYSVTGGNSLDARAPRNNPPSGWTREFGINQSRDEACCVSGTCLPGVPACPGGP